MQDINNMGTCEQGKEKKKFQQDSVNSAQFSVNLKLSKCLVFWKKYSFNIQK